MHIALHGQEFELTGRDDLVALVGSSRQLATWLSRMDRRFRIRSLEVQSADTRFDGSLLFAKLKAEVTDHEGNWIPGGIFMRGDAAAVLIVLRVAGAEHVLLVVQPRFPAGNFESVEIPAGMIDDQGGPLETAVREVFEETGICVEPEQLEFLGEFFPSGGGSDEKLTLFCCALDMTAGKLRALHGASGGAIHEHERLKMLVVPLDDLPKHTRDIKALLAYGFYRAWPRTQAQPR